MKGAVYMPPIANSYVFTKTHVLGEKILKTFRNRFKVVTSRPYVDKKGELPDGYTYTFRVLYDDYD